jgi:hypothetical protein
MKVKRKPISHYPLPISKELKRIVRMGIYLGMDVEQIVREWMIRKDVVLTILVEDGNIR